METQGRPLRLSWPARAAIRLLAPPDERAGILEDLTEEAAATAADRGRRAAARFVRWQIAHSALPWIQRRLRDAAGETRSMVAMTYRGLWSDARIAARRLAKMRGFTALAVGTLAIGIGAVSTAFSLAYALWLKPLPYHEPDRLVWVHARHVPSGTLSSLTAVELAEYGRGPRTLTAIAGFHYGAQIARINGEPVRIVAHRVTPDLFRVLGVRPAIGRDFTEEDASSGSPVLMLSDAAFTKYFGRDPAVTSRLLTLDGRSYTIAGVMPPGFTFPRGLEGEVWVPRRLADEPESPRIYQAVARLAADASIEHATAEVVTRAAQLAAARPATNTDWTAEVSPGDTTASSTRRLAFQALLATVGLFLAVACANLAGLLLARNAGRRAEFAVCLSIGAPRWRLARMLLIESLLLSGAGCAVGILLATYGAGLLATVMPPRTPGLDAVGVNAQVTTVAVVASILSAVFIGVLPALNLRSLRPAEALAGARTVARGGARAQRWLVVAEIAIAVLLIVGAAAMLRSLEGLLDRDRGYDPRGLHALNVSLPFSDDSFLPVERRARAFDEMLARVGAVPGVTRAAATTGFPGSALGILGGSPVPLDGRPAVMAAIHAASPDYFATMGIPVLAGRAFSRSDSTSAAPVAIVNDLLAREFPDGHPIGRRIPLTIYGNTSSYEIVGVTGNIRLGERIGHRVFVPISQASPYWIDLVFRAEPGRPVMPAVRQSLRAISPDLLLENESSFQRIISDSVALERAETAFAGLIGALSAVVAGIGVYALMTFLGAQRRRELGIRLALGSSPRQLFREAFTGGLRLVGAGLAIGLGAAALLVRLAGSQIFGLTSAGPGTYALAAALVVAIALVAIWVPARRAMRVDPLLALRPE
jgi:putative ABC transport system permease protein